MKNKISQKIKIIRSKRAHIFSFCLFFLLITLSHSISPIAFASAQDMSAVSPALYVLAEQNSMAMAAISGNDIAFDSEDFARAMNLSKISEITITQAPPITDGELRVGSTVVNDGQTLSRSNIALLSYTAKSSGISRSSFKFRVNGSPIDIKCDLYMLESANHCPTLSLVPDTALNVSTHKNITLYGTLPCYDPDGDETIIEIVSYPETGILVLSDRSAGDYTFTPGADYSGKDSFTYVARDIYGNYSASATVSLNITKPSVSVVYSDMLDSPAYNAALTMAEAGIMSGTQIGGDTYFQPSKLVSRGEFIVMAMHSAGMTNVVNVSKTIFSDDEDIPTQMKGYISTAYELGYIKGERTENGELCFFPNREITRAEAAVIISNMLNASTPTITPSFSDSSDIPAWAAPSIYSLNSLGIMTSDKGNIAPLSYVTRKDAAEIFSALMVTIEHSK